jgi:HSP20 family molecular chaperone IbpA
MHGISIEKIGEPERGALARNSEMERAVEAIRRRAFDYFEGRGGVFGSDVDDWLRAERELIWSPGAEMTESDKEVTLRVQAPGLEARDIRVTATPESILIQAEVSHEHEESNGKVCSCDFAERLFRRFHLPHEIDVDKVTATLNKGTLQVAAMKTHAAPKGRKIPVANRAHAA